MKQKLECVRAGKVMGFVRLYLVFTPAPGTRKEMLEVFWQSYFKIPSAFFFNHTALYLCSVL